MGLNFVRTVAVLACLTAAPGCPDKPLDGDQKASTKIGKLEAELAKERKESRDLVLKVSRLEEKIRTCEEARVMESRDPEQLRKTTMLAKMVSNAIEATGDFSSNEVLVRDVDKLEIRLYPKEKGSQIQDAEVRRLFLKIFGEMGNHLRWSSGEIKNRGSYNSCDVNFSADKDLYEEIEKQQVLASEISKFLGDHLRMPEFESVIWSVREISPSEIIIYFEMRPEASAENYNKLKRIAPGIISSFIKKKRPGSDDPVFSNGFGGFTIRLKLRSRE